MGERELATADLLLDDDSQERSRVDPMLSQQSNLDESAASSAAPAEALAPLELTDIAAQVEAPSDVGWLPEGSSTCSTSEAAPKSKLSQVHLLQVPAEASEPKKAKPKKQVKKLKGSAAGNAAEAAAAREAQENGMDELCQEDDDAGKKPPSTGLNQGRFKNAAKKINNTAVMVDLFKTAEQEKAGQESAQAQGDDCSTEASPSGDGPNEHLLQLFQAHKQPKVGDLEELLRRRANPDHRFSNRFKHNNVEFTEGCPLQLACTTGVVDLVETLMKHKADILHSRYSKIVGVCGKSWTGHSMFATLPADHIDVLKLLVESYDVDVNIGSRVGDDIGASMLWNAAYFGAEECTKYLLEKQAAVDSAAPSQDNTDLRYTPLHVAARAGKVDCCKMLIQYRASLRGKCEVTLTECEGRKLQGHWYFTPLDDAIEMSQIAVVKMLLEHKAQLMGSKKEMREHLVSSQDKSLRIDRHNYGLQTLLASGNSRVISEVAKALQDSSGQVKYLTCKDIVRFFETPGEAPVNLMQALFFKRSFIRYWKPPNTGANRSKGQGYDDYYRPEYIMKLQNGEKRVFAQLARIRKILVYGKVQFVINLTEGPSTDDVDRHWNDRRHLRDRMPQFVDELAPQPGEDRILASLANLIRDSVYVPVDFFVCLVPNMHRSEEILMAIAGCPNKEIFRLRECEAIVSFNWTSICYTHMFELVIHVIISILMLFAISTLRDKDPEWCASLPFTAVAGIPFVVLTLAMRLVELLGMMRTRVHGSWSLYLLAVDLVLAIGTLALFIEFLVPPPGSDSYGCKDRGVVDEIWFRVAIIAFGSFRWVHCLDMLRLAYSELNMIVTPIVTALKKAMPFCIAVIFLAFVMWQAYWTLDIEEWANAWQAIIVAFRFAVLGDFEVYELEGLDGFVNATAQAAGALAASSSSSRQWKLEDPEPEDPSTSTVVRLLFVFGCGVMFPVLIMNILIAVLSVWLDFAIKNVWLDFQRARARTVLKYKAMYRGLGCARQAPCHEDDDDQDPTVRQTKQQYIWFAAPKEEEGLENDVPPGVNRKFQESADKTDKMDKRLQSLERQIKSLVDHNEKKNSEKRRLKTAAPSLTQPSISDRRQSKCLR